MNDAHFQIAPRFTDHRNIEFGKARVIWAPGVNHWPDSWVLPGGRRTTHYMTAYMCAQEMDTLMRGGKA